LHTALGQDYFITATGEYREWIDLSAWRSISALMLTCCRIYLFCKLLVTANQAPGAHTRS
jgi:hypothetical protein